MTTEKLALDEYRPTNREENDDDEEHKRRRRQSAGRDFYLSAKPEVLKLMKGLTEGSQDVAIIPLPLGSKTTRGAPADAVLKVACNGSQ